ncbi:MAG: MBL fold metallo-hydrolase, partial [Hyphomicrobiaceae bacterium]|nr:MBL fold metallo-hydrolase [Hyphomicrobiaceae bacterium]
MKWQIGDVTVTKVVEIETTGGSRFILPQATREAILPISWLIPHFADEEGRLKMSIHALVVEAPGRRIIVDTCLGNDKQGRRVPTWNERQGRFLEDLAEAGFPRETFDTVLCTHLHTDHVGWNTMLVDGKWVPTFPRAAYLFGRIEYEHWSAQTSREDMQHVFGDSVWPIHEAGLAQLVEWDHQICPEVRLVPSPGHSPGHASVMIESKGQRAMITGDFAHHPCQLAHPEWASTADYDPAAGEATRRRLFGELEGEPVLVIGTHFAGPTAGHVERD